MAELRPRSGCLAGLELWRRRALQRRSLGGTGTYLTPSYTLYDAAVSYGQDNWLVSLNVRNLTDERYVTTCQGGACYFGDGRNIALTLTSKF
nr:TonB-dependent receptor [Phaeobacter sp. LSS9]